MASRVLPRSSYVFFHCHFQSLFQHDKRSRRRKSMVISVNILSNIFHIWILSHLFHFWRVSVVVEQTCRPEQWRMLREQQLPKRPRRKRRTRLLRAPTRPRCLNPSLRLLKMLTSCWGCEGYRGCNQGGQKCRSQKLKRTVCQRCRGYWEASPCEWILT